MFVDHSRSGSSAIRHPNGASFAGTSSGECDHVRSGTGTGCSARHSVSAAGMMRTAATLIAAIHTTQRLNRPMNRKAYLACCFDFFRVANPAAASRPKPAAIANH